VFIGVMIAAASIVGGSEITAVPSLAVGEEYNDNIFLVTESASVDYITHLVPAIDAKYASPIWVWQLNCAYDRQFYAKNTYIDNNIPRVFLRSTVGIVKDLLYLDVRDDAGRTSLSVVQDYTKESPVTNQTNYNAFEVGPYAVLQLTSRMTLTTGYLYRSVWYKDPTAIDRTQNSFYGNIAQKQSERTDLSASIGYDRVETSLHKWTKSSVLFGPQYEYQNGSFLWGRIGTSRTAVDDARTDTHLVWDAGITYHMGSMSVRGETGRTWVEDPYRVERREDRYVAGLRVENERTSGGFSAALRDYGVGQYNDERRYTTTADFSHYLSEKLQGKYALTIDRYENYPADSPDTMTIVYNTDIRFDHHSTASLTLSLSYRYTDSYSPNLYGNNYQANRVLAEVKKIF
jgi:hypothetical protein